MVRLLIFVLLLYFHSSISLDTNSSPDIPDTASQHHPNAVLWMLSQQYGTASKDVTKPSESSVGNVSPFSNSSGIHSGIYRANLSDCFSKPKEELMCFVGSGCFNHKPYYKKWGVHQEFIQYWEGLESRYGLDNDRTAIEECDVGATLYIRDGYIDLQFHTNAKNWLLFLFFKFSPQSDREQWIHIFENDGEPIRKWNTNDKRLDDNWNGELYCNPHCSFTENERMHTKDTYFWSGKVILRKNNTVQPNVTIEIETSVKLANIASCFEDSNTTCYFGDSCITEKDGMSRNHTQFTPLDYHSDVKENATFQLELQKCNVAAILKRIGKHRPASYEFELQTTEGNLQLGFIHEGMDIYIDNGAIVCRPNCEFEQLITNESTTEKQLSRSLYWNGKINKRRSPDSSNDGKVDPKKLRENGKINKKEDPDEEESEMGMILIICGCAVVALVIITVIIGTIIQHRHNAKNKRKREAIQRATAAKAAKASSSSTDLLKKADAPKTAIPCEIVPLTGGTVVSDDEPTSEKTTTTQFGTLEK